MRQQHSQVVRMFCVLLIVAVLAGCGGVPQTGRAGDTITFGAAISLTGKTFKEGEYVRDGYQLWIDRINQQGGLKIGGRTYRVALRYYDDESRAERTTQLVEKLIVEDKVDFLLGPYATLPTAAAAVVAERQQVPLIDSNGAAESVVASGYRYTFAVLSPAKNYLRAVIDLVLAQTPPARTVAILGNDETFSRETANGAAQYAVSKGMQVVYLAFYPADSQDIRGFLREVKDHNPDLVLGTGHLQDSLLLVKQAKELGLSPKAMGFSVGPTAPKFREHLREDADYIYGATQWTSALKYRGDDLWGTPAAYTAAFRARYPDYREVPYHAAQSTAALVAYQRALEMAGSLDREAVRDALANLDMMTFFGRIKFDERGWNVYKPMAVEQLQPDGGKYTVFPFDVAERGALYPTPPWSERTQPQAAR